MKRVGKPSGKVTLLGTYDVDHDNHIVYHLGVDEIGKHYSIEEHEYNVGSAYSMSIMLVQHILFIGITIFLRILRL